MIDYNFIEIGTSNFDTLIETASDNTVGLSIEPLTHYLESLPNKKNVKKINCAVALDNIEKDCTIYYIPEETIIENKLPIWLTGCNSINDFHPHHKTLQIESLVKTKIIKQYPISRILIDNSVRKIDYLKIDTEGGDCDILSHLKIYLEDKSKDFYPKKITFETNRLTDRKKINDTIDLYISIGYKLEERTKADTTLVYSQ
jgi:hypothetical protein